METPPASLIGRPVLATVPETPRHFFFAVFFGAAFLGAAFFPQHAICSTPFRVRNWCDKTGYHVLPHLSHPQGQEESRFEGVSWGSLGGMEEYLEALVDRARPEGASGRRWGVFVVTEQSSERRSGKCGGRPVIALVNEGDGVAKAGACANLAVSLARRGRRVLCLDFDPQANLTGALGIPREVVAARNSLMLLRRGDLSLKAVIVATEMANLQVVPACSELGRWEEETAADRGRLGRLRERLGEFGGEICEAGYEVVLLDAPPSSGALARTVLTAATHVVVPVTPESYSLGSVARLEQLVADLQRETGATVRLLGLLVTLRDFDVCLDATLYRLLKERVEQEFGDLMFSRTLPYRALVSGPEAGRSRVVVHAAESAAAEAYQVLAGEMLARLEQDREDRYEGPAGSLAAG